MANLLNLFYFVTHINRCTTQLKRVNQCCFWIFTSDVLQPVLSHVDKNIIRRAYNRPDYSIDLNLAIAMY